MPVKLLKLKPIKTLQRGESSGRIIVLWIAVLGLGGLTGWLIAESYLQAVKAPPANSSPQQRVTTGLILMVSGRDDHGLLQDPLVPIYRAPEDSTVVARVTDGSIVRVVDQRSEWIRVQMITDAQATGWVHDYYLRNRMLRTDGGGQVDLLDARDLGDKVLVYVRAVADPAATPVWLDSKGLLEIGAHIDK
jgi:hypothetical protein